MCLNFESSLLMSLIFAFTWVFCLTLIFILSLIFTLSSIFTLSLISAFVWFYLYDVHNDLDINFGFVCISSLMFTLSWVFTSSLFFVDGKIYCFWYYIVSWIQESYSFCLEFWNRMLMAINTFMFAWKEYHSATPNRGRRNLRPEARIRYSFWRPPQACPPGEAPD